MGLIKLDGFEGYGPDDTRAADDSTLERRINVRWNRIRATYQNTNDCSRIVGAPSARGGKLCWDMRTYLGKSWVSWVKGGLTQIVIGFAVRPWMDNNGDQLYLRRYCQVLCSEKS